MINKTMDLLTLQKMADNPFYSNPLNFLQFYQRFEQVQSINCYIMYCIFLNSEKIVKSNRSANQVRNKRLPSHRHPISNSIIHWWYRLRLATSTTFDSPLTWQLEVCLLLSGTNLSFVNRLHTDIQRHINKKFLKNLYLFFVPQLSCTSLLHSRRSSYFFRSASSKLRCYVSGKNFFTKLKSPISSLNSVRRFWCPKGIH